MATRNVGLASLVFTSNMRASSRGDQLISQVSSFSARASDLNTTLFHRRTENKIRMEGKSVTQPAFIGQQLNSTSDVMCRSLHTTSSSVLQFPSRATRAKLMTAEGARDFVDSLNKHQRRQLEVALEELKEEEVLTKGKDRVEKDEETKMETKVEVSPPTWLQLRLLCYQQALPFLGFGFLDNFVMITVGEYIDITIGAALTISTMAAAGLGNLISDLAGLGLADRVEALCRMVGIPNPHMSSAQLHFRSSRWMGLLGRCLGISVGCLLGMLPLLWFDRQHKEDKHEA